MRRNLLFRDKPAKHNCRPAGGICGQPLGVQIKPIQCANLNLRLGADLGLPDRCGCRYIDDDRVVQIDLIAGSKNSFIATLVERQTRYVMVAKVKNKDTAGVVAALTGQVQHLPRELRLSLTWDRGKEMADHKRLTLATDLDIYFCDPHSPWQRGTNEHTNRFLRQFFPKGTDRTYQSTARTRSIPSRGNSTKGRERR